MDKLIGLGQVHNFGNVTSCGTSTAYSVPCMFSYLGAEKYDVDTADYHENVIDTLDRLGVAILWRDNNSDSKGVMNRLPAKQYQDYKTAPFKVAITPFATPTLMMNAVMWACWWI